MFTDPIRSTPFVQDISDITLRLRVQRADSALYLVRTCACRICASRSVGSRYDDATARSMRKNRPHVADVVGIVAGRFENRRLRAQFGMREQRPKAAESDVSFADVPMTIAARPKRHFGIVEVEHQHAVQPDTSVGRSMKSIDPRLRIDFVTGRPRVRRVETHA